jgi:hypothetical protein
MFSEPFRAKVQALVPNEPVASLISMMMLSAGLGSVMVTAPADVSTL